MPRSVDDPPYIGACAKQIRKYFRKLDWTPCLNSKSCPGSSMYVQAGHIYIKDYEARIRCKDGTIITKSSNLGANDKQVLELLQSPFIQKYHLEPRLMAELMKRNCEEFV